MINYLLCFILFLIGLYGVLTRRNIIKIVIGLSFMEFSINLFFVLIGYVHEGIAPIIGSELDGRNYVDPLPQALVLTAIVIGVATTAMMMAVAIRLYKRYGTFDIRKMNQLKG